MAIDTIKSTAVLDGAIATADIADDAVTADKLANSINTSIAVGSTANTTANAALPKAGGTMTGDLIISDNVRVRLGSPTSTSYHSSHEVLQIGDGSALLGNDGSKGSQLITNAYTTAGSSLNGYKYIATDKASSYQQYDGAHNFRVAGSGSADAAITWTTGLEVLNAGQARAKNGLLFGTDTAAANALDDYEEGTWNLVLQGSGGSAGSWAQSGTSAKYTKIGNAVHFSGTAYLTNTGSYNGYVVINGLPFVSNSAHNISCPAAGIPIGQFNSTNYMPLIIGGNSYMHIRKGQYGDATALYSEVTINVRIIVSGTYFI